MTDGAKPSALSLGGEIVEIIEAGGVRTLRVVLHDVNVYDLASPLVSDLHLGDRIVIDGVLRVDSVRLTVEREARRTS